MSNPTPPPGWDDVEPGMIAAAHEMRKMYFAFVMAGFTNSESVQMVAHICAATFTNNSNSTGDTS